MAAAGTAPRTSSANDTAYNGDAGLLLCARRIARRAAGERDLFEFWVSRLWTSRVQPPSWSCAVSSRKSDSSTRKTTHNDAAGKTRHTGSGWETPHIRHSMGAPNRTITGKRAFCQAMARMKAFLPMDNWPEQMVKLFLGPSTLSYAERLRMLTFLVGNGYPVDAVCTVLAPRLRSTSSARHANGVLKDLASGRNDRRWYYFNVNEQDWLVLDGTPYGDPRGNQVFTRCVNAWDKRCWKGKDWPTLEEQEAFIGM